MDEQEDFSYVGSRALRHLESQPSKSSKSVAFSVIEEIEAEMADDVVHGEKTRHYVTVSSRW